MRKRIYPWHRRLSLIVALPVVLWAASGFMHPIMTNIRPRVAQPNYTPAALDSHRFIVSLDTALYKNHITAIHSFRIVQINGNYFYQISIPKQDTLTYISTQSGNLLKNGDELYARYLARIFTEGEPVKKQNSLLASLEKPAPVVKLPDEAKEAIPEHDCCINATASVLNVSKGAPVGSVERITGFTEEYKNINRLLPVYRVAFNRPDGIRVYVETGQDRLACAMDNKRAVFDKIFMLFHKMSWLNGLGTGKLLVESLLMLLTMLTAVSGLWLLFTTRAKKVVGNPSSKWRWNHRYTSGAASLFTLLFSFSGFYHAITKIGEEETVKSEPAYTFEANTLRPDWTKIFGQVPAGEQMTNISVVSINGKPFWQLFHRSLQSAKKNPAKKAADFVKAMNTGIPDNLYLNASDYSLLADGEKKYAASLAAFYSGQLLTAIQSIQPVTKFEGEYGFVNKRLPVWKLDYSANHNERYYVETSSAALAATINDQDLYEGYSFSFLHKHHFMDFAGKSWRDFSTMFWAAMQIIMVLVGISLFIKLRFTHDKKSKQ